MRTLVFFFLFIVNFIDEWQIESKPHTPPPIITRVKIVMVLCSIEGNKQINNVSLLESLYSVF